MKVVSMRGQSVDMTRLAAENANAIALGNASMNARGDIIEADGNVIKSREQIARDYHVTNPKAVRQMALRDIRSEVFVTPAEAVATHREAMREQTKAIQEQTKTKKRRIADTD